MLSFTHNGCNYTQSVHPQTGLAMDDSNCYEVLALICPQLQAPSGLTLAQLQDWLALLPGFAALQTHARKALTQSDITVLRCTEAGAPLPQAWRDYRMALRAIISATNHGAALPDLPARPAAPQGT